MNLAKQKYKNILCKYRINNKNFSSNIVQILPLSHKEISFSLNRTTTIPINLSYESEAGQKFKDNFSVTIFGKNIITKKDIKPIPKIIKNESNDAINETNSKTKENKNLLVIGIISAFFITIGFFIIFLKKKLK
jgi:hypothetical protein